MYHIKNILYLSNYFSDLAAPVPLGGEQAAAEPAAGVDRGARGRVAPPLPLHTHADAGDIALR